MKSFALAVSMLLLGACVSRQRDHFYVLTPLPAATGPSRAQFDRQVTVRVTIPSIVDRSEIVVGTPSGVEVMDHERWAAPLADMVTVTLGQDLERRRKDVVVLPKSADKSGLPLVRIVVEIDQVNARLGDHLSIETHWRVTDSRSGKETLGRDTFVSQQQAQSYSEFAAALSACIALLADRLTAEIPIN
jgi:uncharacterized protein